MTKQEKKVGDALFALVAETVNAIPYGDGGRHDLAGIRCEVFADKAGNVWAKDEDGRLVGRVGLTVLPCPT